MQAILEPDAFEKIRGLGQPRFAAHHRRQGYIFESGELGQKEVSLEENVNARSADLERLFQIDGRKMRLACFVRHHARSDREFSRTCHVNLTTRHFFGKHRSQGGMATRGVLA